MKNIYFSVALILALVGLVASGPNSGRGINTECQDAGYDFWIAKYDWGGETFFLSEGPLAGYSVNVSGHGAEASWTCEPAAAAIIEKESTDRYIYPGGTSGTVEDHDHYISHITFCGKYSTTSTTIPTAPEFGSMRVLAVLVLTAPTFVYLLVKGKR